MIVLLAVGPDKLPTFMRTVGKGLRQVRRPGQATHVHANGRQGASPSSQRQPRVQGRDWAR
ncbi:MAG: twin-arginine translocase TatA/TatE family subunit [Deltaproteobacteria bacterium]|nr:twin-arginine translocase TatA/TatE family subunit [Deltaproteobacteria bacterium]